MSVYAVASGRSRVPQVSVRDLEENTMCFEVRDTDCSTANSLRRVMVGEVVSMAIDLVTFEENTSVVNDEIIAHRLGLVPIKYTYKPDKTRLREDMGPSEAAAMSSDRDIRRRFRHTRDCDCDSHCDFCAATLKLHVSFDDRAKDLPEHEKNNPLTVTTLDLVSDDPDVAPVHFVSKREESTSQETGIALVKLAKGQELKLTCIAKLGCGKEHAKWIPVSKCVFRPVPEVTWDDAAVAELAPTLRDAIIQVCPAGVLGYADDRDRSKIEVKDEAAILDFADDIHALTKTLNPTGKSMLFARPSTTNFIFDVESLGSIPVDDVVLCGINELKRKLTNLQLAVNEIAETEA
ncbi:DNA-directed 5'-3' RNA polymerase [Aureococcus anophagefferens]|uniref:DNA-directed 5'-3' RNA polymerase n=1 Tax=Aureococcus anophagefferens TaxID=44056 RepID=A0ABR1G090_AURAN|nr:DNA-directed 5'-3' RNA polymerase [Aureococcus anophagefferens]